MNHYRPIRSMSSRSGLAFLPLLKFGAVAAAAILADQAFLNGYLTGNILNAIVMHFSQSGGILLAKLFSLFPKEWNLNWDQVEPYYGFLNRWVPLNYGFGLLTSYWAAWSGIIGFRWAMKLIPFINGG